LAAAESRRRSHRWEASLPTPWAGRSITERQAGIRDRVRAARESVTVQGIFDTVLRRRHLLGAIARTGAVIGLAGSLLLGPVVAGAAPARQTPAIPCADPAPVTFFAAADGASASPVASPLATPASEADASASAGAGDAAPIELLIQTIASCQTQRRVKTLTHLVSEGFLGDVYAGGGTITAEEFIAFGRALPDLTVTIVSVANVRIGGDRHATAEVVSTIGHQLVRARWSFVFKPLPPGDNTGDEAGLGRWIAEGVRALPVEAPEDATTAKVTIAKNAYSPAKIAAAGPDLVLAATNTDKVDHELFVVALAKGVTTQDLLSAPGAALPDGVTVIGQLTIPAKGGGAMVLVSMEAGSYSVVDLLPSSDGAPYLAHGMEATLTIQ
jgi:hypothetical protein